MRVVASDSATGVFTFYYPVFFTRSNSTGVPHFVMPGIHDQFESWDRCRAPYCPDSMRAPRHRTIPLPSPGSSTSEGTDAFFTGSHPQAYAPTDMPEIWRTPYFAPYSTQNPERPSVAQNSSRRTTRHIADEDDARSAYVHPFVFPEFIHTNNSTTWSPDSMANGNGNVDNGPRPWRTYPWSAHPLPHPSVPAEQFWGLEAETWWPWRGPRGWIPSERALDPMYMRRLLGGHPLPGHDLYWTPIPYAITPLSASTGISKSVTISSCLAPNPRNPYKPHILWNAAIERPDRMKRVTSAGTIINIGATFLNEPATTPGVGRLQVRLQNMRDTWGAVLVEAENGVSGTVTVRDVFHAVWKYLQKPINQDDRDSLCNSPGGKKRWQSIERAYHQRCRAAPALEKYEQKQGVRRVDFLRCKSAYWGCYISYNIDGSWYLCMQFK